MATAIASKGFTRDAFETFISARDEPSWLIDMRRKAWRRFQEMPMPSVRDEAWMRTDIRLFKLDRFDLPDVATAPPGADDSPHALLAAGVDLGGQAATFDSGPLATGLDEKWSRQGVLFGSLDALVIEDGDLLRPFFERRVVDPYKDKFSALHAA